MVILRFFKNKKLIGAKEFYSDSEAEAIGEKWLKKARSFHPGYFYHYEMLTPVYLIPEKPTLDGNINVSRYVEASKAVCYSDRLPRMELIFRKTTFGLEENSQWDELIM